MDNQNINEVAAHLVFMDLFNMPFEKIVETVAKIEGAEMLASEKQVTKLYFNDSPERITLVNSNANIDKTGIKIFKETGTDHYFIPFNNTFKLPTL